MAHRVFPATPSIMSAACKRPPELVQSWRDWEAGELPFEELHEVQDRAIREAVAMQERLGLPIVTDGEFRRGGWSRGFLNAVDGFEFRASKLTFRNDEGVSTASPAPVASKPIRRKQPIVTDDFKFLQSVAKNRIKVTMPTPSHMHFGQFKEAIDRKVYPTDEPYWDDMIAVFQQEMPSSTPPAAVICSSTRCRSRCCATGTSARSPRARATIPTNSCRFISMCSTARLRAARPTYDRHASVPRQHGRPLDGRRRLRADRRCAVQPLRCRCVPARIQFAARRRLRAAASSARRQARLSRHHQHKESRSSKLPTR